MSLSSGSTSAGSLSSRSRSSGSLSSESLSSKPSSSGSSSLRSAVRWVRLGIAFALLVSLGSITEEGQGATVEAALAQELRQGAPDEFHSAIFVLQEQTDVQGLRTSLNLRRADRADRHASVVRALQRTAAESQRRFLRELESRRARGSVEGYTPYWIANLVVVSATRTALFELSNHPDVDHVERNFRPRLIEPVELTDVDPEARRAGTVQPGLRALRADEVWYELGVNGEGTLVACLDTGVSVWHPAVQGRWRGRRADPRTAWFDVSREPSQEPRDYHGHGSHVLGIMCGLDSSLADTIGVAWGAEWIAANNLSPLGPAASFDNDVIRAFQWFADPDGDPTTHEDVPDVVQNSWGVGRNDEGYDACDTRWWTVIDHCEAAGVVVTFSAGNDGPVPRSMISPADRATTFTNAFSVGAIDATSLGFPFGVAGFSSRGPSRCTGVISAHLTKPEVVAPGVSVYSIWPTAPSNYKLASGTSMAGPHVAGVVALMRQVNPELTPDEVKTILMETAAPTQGWQGENNSSGWGTVDAYEAVLAAAAARGSGRIAGFVGDAASARPVAEASIRLLGVDSTWRTGPTGRFGAFAPLGTYDLEVVHPLLETRVYPAITVEPAVPVEVELTLSDRTGPRVERLHLNDALLGESDSVGVFLEVAEHTEVESVEVVYRNASSTYQIVPAALDPYGLFTAWIRERSFGDRVQMYVIAKDVLGNVQTYPESGASDPHEIGVARAHFFDDGEEDQGWTFGVEGDSPYGGWVRLIPYGTTYDGILVEPDADASPRGDVCFYTGRSRPNADVDRTDVDEGCVSLVSPPFDLRGSFEPILSYTRWFAAEGRTKEGLFLVEVSSDDGLTWIPLERLRSSQNTWTRISLPLRGVVELSSTVRLRFQACDFGEDTFIEGAVDDVEIRSQAPRDPDPGDDSGPVVALPDFGTSPNPFRQSTTIRFRLPGEEIVDLAVHDLSGRRVRTLLSGSQPGGENSIDWDGRDDAGRAVPSGIYFYRFEAETLRTDGRIVLVR